MHQSTITKTLLALGATAALSTCAFALTVPSGETGLAVRLQGEVAVHFDQGELVKRVNAALVASALTALGAVTYAACQATAPIQPVVAATVCVVAAVSTWVGALATLWRGLQNKRDLDGAVTAIHNGVEYKHYYPASEDGPSALELLQRAYIDTPILVSHHTCEGHGCFQAHYSNHHNSELNTTVHRFTTTERNSTSRNKRQDDMESGNADSNGNTLITDYVFQNDNAADERAEGSDGGFPTQFLNLVGAETSYTQQGYKCLSVLDADDNNAVGAQGYITIVQDHNIADPDNEASYISSCA